MDLSNDPWGGIIHAVSEKSMMLGSHLEKCSLKELGDRKIIIEAGGSRFGMDALNKKENLEKIRSICNDLFKAQFALSIVEPEQKEQAEPAEDKAQKRLDVEKEALDHPMVVEALNVFGGRVIEIKNLT